MEYAGDVLDVLKVVAMILGFGAMIASPAIVQWGKKYFSSTEDTKNHGMRIEALEKEDLGIRADQLRLKNEVAEHLKAVEAELQAIEKMDRRLYRVAVLLSQRFPEEAKHIKLLEDL